jgi:hypothetical protein
MVRNNLLKAPMACLLAPTLTRPLVRWFAVQVPGRSLRSASPGGHSMNASAHGLGPFANIRKIPTARRKCTPRLDFRPSTQLKDTRLPG